MDTHTSHNTRWYHAVSFALAVMSLFGSFGLTLYMQSSAYLQGGIILAMVFLVLAAPDIFSNMFYLMRMSTIYSYRRARTFMAQPNAWPRLRAYAFFYAPFWAFRMALPMFGPTAALLFVAVMVPRLALYLTTDLRIILGVWLASIVAAMVAMGFALKWSAKLSTAACEKEKTIYHPAFIQKLAARGL